MGPVEFLNSVSVNMATIGEAMEMLGRRRGEVSGVVLEHDAPDHALMAGDQLFVQFGQELVHGDLLAVRTVEGVEVYEFSGSSDLEGYLNGDLTLLGKVIGVWRQL